MKLTVVVPVFNEEERVRSALEELLGHPFPWDREVVVVDDGSTDRTPGILADFKGRPDVRILRLPENIGKGAAVRRGFSEADGDAVAVFDADLEYAAQDLVPLAAPVLGGGVAVCFGSRFLGRATPRGLHGLFNRLISRLVSLATGEHLSDMETCLKCFSREVASGMRLEADGFGIEPELTVEAIHRSGRILEVPVRYAPRTRAQGKKIRWRDAFVTLWWLWRALVRWKSGDAFGRRRAPSPRNPAVTPPV
jgi:glycosyltransferase involved in cell wall biosynthesis